MASVELQEASWNTRTVGVSRSVHVRVSEAAEREVQALLDVPRVGQEGGGVVEKVQERRRERHEQYMSDLQAELSAISEKLQSAVKKAAEEMKHKLSDSLQVTETVVAKVSSSSEGLCGLTLTDVEGVWQGVESQLTLRLNLIEELNKELTQVEEQRAHDVCECLQRFSGLLGSVAYCSPGELGSIMEEKAHALNMASLSNRQSAARLCAQLAAAERKVAVELQARWEAGVRAWRDAVVHDTLARFKLRIGTSGGEERMGEVGGVERGRSEVERVKGEMVAELSGLQHRKQQLLAQVSSLAPPTVVMETLYRIQEASHDIHQQMESCLQRQLLVLSQAWEQVASACEAEMEASKTALLLSGVCDSSSVYQVLTADFLPLTEGLVEEGHTELRSIEHSVESHLVQHESWFQSVLQYGMGVAQLWRDHNAALINVRRSRGEELDCHRSEHDTRNQTREANLDLVLDHMRQAPNEEVLDKCLQEATRLLKDIAEGYEEFHRALLTEVGAWPSVAQHSVQEYDSALCQYLRVGREPPSTRKTERAKKITQSVSRPRAGSKRLKKTPPSTSSPVAQPPNVTDIVEEVIVAKGVVKYYITSEGLDGKTEGVFLTQDEDNEEAPNMIAHQALPLHRSSYQQARTSVRAMFLGHLETWKEEVRTEEEREVRERQEEAHVELDLRRHLHKPRLARIMQDVHGVRTAELVAHRDRVSRHARAVVTAIADIKSTAQTAPECMKAQEEDYAEEMVSLEGCLTEAVSIMGLEQVESTAHHLLEKRLQFVQSTSTQLQTAAEEAIAELSRANTAFRDSLKLFSEAGNYCPEEVEVFSHKLDRLAGKLATAQSQVTGDISVACNEYTHSATKVFTHFQSTYQLHQTDAGYLESVRKSLISLQLSIQSAVADSNSQTSKLHDNIARLKDDMESGDLELVLIGLPPLISLCNERTAYLHCRATLQQGGRVGGGGGQGGRMVGGEGGHNQPISSVNITRSIRKHTRASTENQVAVTSSNKPPPLQETGEKVGSQSRRKAAAAVVERKNVNFGVGGGEETSCFLPQIRSFLYVQYADLYTTTEAYYRAKGLRPVTRPQSMASTCEEALDRLIASCQTYRHQCEDYRDRAISEFRAQLDTVLSLLVGLTPLVLKGISRQYMTRWERERRDLEDSHQRTMETMAKEKSSHKAALHPGLGHPAATTQLQELRDAEDQRHCHLLEHTQQHMASIQNTVQGIGRELAMELVAETERLLALYDTLPTTNEIIPSRQQETHHLPVDHLLRLRLRPPEQSRENPGIPQSSSQGGNWPGVSTAVLDRLLVPLEERERMSSGVVTKKSSVAHRAVLTARDAALEEFVVCVEKMVLWSEERGKEEREREQHWWDHWNHSLTSLTQLYYN